MSSTIHHGIPEPSVGGEFTVHTADRTTSFPRPSALQLRHRTAYCLLGQNKSGLWIIRENTGCKAGVFLSRGAAIRFARLESPNRHFAVLHVPRSLGIRIMRLSIYEQFIVGVVRPTGGWSKGRPAAYVEEDDKCVPRFDLLIPNDLDDMGIAAFVGERFCAFAQAGRRVELLQAATPLGLGARAS